MHRSDRMFALLTAHIIRQRNKRVESNGHIQEGQIEEQKDAQGVENTQPLNTKSGDEQTSPVTVMKDPEETIEDIEHQIENYQKKLEAYKEEKHMLFQELKKVLHDEDERKKHKELEEKQQNAHNIQKEISKVPQNDVALDSKPVVSATIIEQPPAIEKGPSVMGVKRSLPSSPEVSQLESTPPPVKHHRGPLLPNPDTPMLYGRGPYLSGGRRPYGPRMHYVGGPRQAYHDLRFNQSHVHMPDIHPQGLPPCPLTPTTPHATSFPHLPTVPEFHGVQSGFPFLGSPPMPPFVNSTEAGQQPVTPIQLTIPGGYGPKHPTDIQGQHSCTLYTSDLHMQLQSHLSDPQLQTYGHQDIPHFICQPTPLFNEYPQGSTYMSLDPRHPILDQSLKMDSPPQSPGFSGAARKHTVPKGLPLS